MNTLEITEHRQLLFESIEWKLDSIYHATRSIRYAEEMREYTLAILSIMHDYLDIHKNHFQIKKFYHSQRQSHNKINSLIKATNYQVLSRLWIELDSIRRWTWHHVRQHIIWLFSRILEIHCVLEGMDFYSEYNKRFIEIGIFTQYKTFKISNKQWLNWRWGWRLSSWRYWFWSKLEKWSWRFKARCQYDCTNCPEPIHVWEYYYKEVIRMDSSVEILRNHIHCPHDPYDPRDNEEEEDGATVTQKKAA